MAKSQKRSGREAKKPKQDKKKPLVSTPLSSAVPVKKKPAGA
jgi:hypothetical protein